MKTLLLCSLSFLLLISTGCVRDVVPRTKISGSIGGKPFSMDMPKDVTLGSAIVTADTNGAVSISIVNLTTRMNPDVITTSGDAQVKLIEANGKLLLQAVEAAKTP